MATTLELESLRVTITADAISYLAASSEVRNDVKATVKSLGTLTGSADAVTTAFSGLASGISTVSAALQQANLAASTALVRNLGVDLRALVSGKIADKLKDLAAGIGQVASADINRAAESFTKLGTALKASQLGLATAGKAVTQTDALVGAFGKIAAIDAKAVTSVTDTIASSITNIANALYTINAKGNRVGVLTPGASKGVLALGDALKGLEISPRQLTNLAGVLDILPKLRDTLLGMELGLKAPRAAMKSLDMLTESLKNLSDISPSKIRAIMDALGGNAVAANLASKGNALATVAASAKAAANEVLSMSQIMADAGVQSAVLNIARRQGLLRPMGMGPGATSQMPFFMRPSPVSFMTGGLGQTAARTMDPMASALGAMTGLGVSPRPMPMDLLAVATRQAEIAQAAAAARAARMQAIWERITSPIATMRSILPSAMSAVGSAATSVVSTIGNMGEAMIAATPKAARLSGSMNMLGRSAIGARTSMSLTQLSIAALAGFSLVQFAHFDTAINRMLARMGDYRGQFRVLTSEATMDLAGRTTTGASSLAGGLGVLSATGMNVPMALQALPIAESFAAASGMEMSRATRHLTSVLSAMGMASENASTHLANLTHISDAFVRSSQLVDISIEEMSEAFNARFAASLRQANVTMEEGIGIIAAYAAANVRGGDAGNRGSIVMQSLEHAMIGHLHTWQALGLNILDANSQLKKMPDIIQMLENRLAGLNPVVQRATLQAAGFESRVTQALYPMLGFSHLMRDTTAAAHDVGGALEATANMIRQSFGSQIIIMWNNVKNLAIVVGRTLAPAIAYLAEGIGFAASWFRELNPYLQRVIVWGALASTMLPVVAFVVTSLGTAFTFVASTMGIVLSTGGLIVGSVLALDAVILTALGGWGLLGRTLTSIWAGTLSMLRQLGAGFSYSIGLVANFQHNMQALSDWFAMEQATDFVNLGDMVELVYTNMAHNVGVAVGAALEYVIWFKDNFTNILTDIGTVFGNILRAFVPVVQLVVTVVGRLLEGLWRGTFLTALRQGMNEAGVEFRRGILNLGDATPTGRMVAGLGQPGLSTQAIESMRAGQFRDLTTEEIATAITNTGDLLRRVGDPLITDRTREGILALRASLVQVRDERSLVSNLPGQIAQAMRQPDSRFITPALPTPSMPFRGLFDVSAGSARARDRVNAVMGQSLAASLGSPFGLAAAAHLGDLTGFVRTPNLVSDTSAMRRAPQALADTSMMKAIVAGMVVAGGPMAMFGEILARQALPMFRGGRVIPSDSDLEMPQLSRHGPGQKFEQLSFNRFMLGGPETARMEQQVRAQGVENLLRNTNELINDGNRQRSDALNRPAPPAVAGP